ncbi:MAG: PP2C family protein-serine/threonine phosphatase [Clostridia bacterium]|nr:PP2C family protein-serine/threonine phosphatase [Clostridia bacterium]
MPSIFREKIKLNTNIKALTIIGAINFINSIIICVVLYNVIVNNKMEDYGSRTYNAAKVTSRLIDISKVMKYRDTLKIDKEYEEPVKLLDKIKSDLDLRYLYVESWDDSGQRFIIYDATEPGDGVTDSAYNRDLLGHKMIEEEYANQVMTNRDSIDEYRKVNTSYGNTICSYCPLKDENGKNIALVGADMDIQKVMSRINRIVFLITIIIQIFIILFTVLSIYAINFYFSRPLKKIAKIVSNFVNKKHDKINIEPIEFKNIKESDDIGIVASAFNKMMLDVKEYAKHIKDITAEKEQVTAELNVATQIQKSLIPHIFPAFPELEEMDIYAIMQPAQKVGGDFYDFFLLDSEHLAFVIADVSGKGVPAALFMVIAKTLLKNESNSIKDPKKILENVNRQMCQDNNSGMFVTMFFGILDLKTGEVEYSNAGHTKPIGKMQSKSFKEIDIKKQFVLGGMPNLKFKTDKIWMKKGDILFMYTDGISEAQDKNGICWGKENIISALDSLDTDKCDLKFISETVCNKVYDFMGDMPQSDDITMLIIKYNGNENSKRK